MTDSTPSLVPAFLMDCRDWITVSPDDAGLEDVADAPLLAVLSTAVIAEDIHEARGVIMVGVLDGSPLNVRPVDGTGLAVELVQEELDNGDTVRRFVLPAPTGDLALLAEFDLSDRDPELQRRVEALVTSFRWQKAA